MPETVCSAPAGDRQQIKPRDRARWKLTAGTIVEATLPPLTVLTVSHATTAIG